MVRSITQAGAALPIVPAARRRELAALPIEPGAHARLLAELGFDTALEQEPPPEPRAPAGELRVVAWNAQRCPRVEASAALLAASGADVFLLSELDRGMARSQQRDTPRELAARLGCGCAFGVEFLELGLGDEREREAWAGHENAIGYHGGALLARQPFARARLVRLERGGRWFDGARGERRIGGRIAVLASLELAGREVAFASIHLESHSDPDERAAQLEVVLAALDELSPGAPALVGGDVNTHSLGRAELEDRDALARALARDPRRLAEPIAHEPLFALAERRGYDYRACNALGTSSERRSDGRGTWRGRLCLDWFFARGLEVADPRVIPALDPVTGEALSDHEAIAVTLRLPAR